MEMREDNSQATICNAVVHLLGFANGMLFFSSTIILHHYFDRRRTLAAAIATCGFSTATLTMPPITRWLISCLGWRTTTLVISAIFLQSAICGALMWPNNHDNRKPMTNDEKSGEAVHSSVGCCRSVIRGASWLARSVWTSLDVTIFRNPRFPIFQLGSCLTVFGYVVPCVFIPILAVTSLGMSPSTSALLLSLWAVSTIVGRISSGLMGDRLSFFRLPGRQIYLYAVPNIFCGLCTASVFVIRSQAAYIFYVILFGTLTGSFVSAQQPVAVDLFGMKDFSKTLAFLILSFGIAGFICQPFAGWLVDLSGAFRLAFLANGLIQTFSGFLLLVLVFLGPSKSKTTENVISEKDIEPTTVITCVDSNHVDPDHKDKSFQT